MLGDTSADGVEKAAVVRSVRVERPWNNGGVAEQGETSESSCAEPGPTMAGSTTTPMACAWRSHQTPCACWQRPTEQVMSAIVTPNGIFSPFQHLRPSFQVGSVPQQRRNIFQRKGHACRDRTWYMTPQRLELQKRPKCDVLLACAATRSRSRRGDMDENTAAATARKKSEPTSQNTLGHREKGCGWRL